MDDRTKGLESRYLVERITETWPNGNPRMTVPVQEQVFVLKPSSDPHAIPALRAYAKSARADGFTALADDLDKWADSVW